MSRLFFAFFLFLLVQRGVKGILNETNYAPLEMAPFVVSIGVVSSEKYYHACSGAIVSNLHIYTSRECAEDVGFSPAVRVGTTDPKFSGGLRVEVDKIITYPDASYDAALVVLKEPLVFVKGNIEKISYAIQSAYGFADIFTFGQSKNKSKSVLQPLTLVSDEFYPCKESFYFNCFKNIKPCASDSAAPVLRDNSPHGYTLVGLLPYAPVKSSKEDPSVVLCDAIEPRFYLIPLLWVDSILRESNKTKEPTVTSTTTSSSTISSSSSSSSSSSTTPSEGTSENPPTITTMPDNVRCDIYYLCQQQSCSPGMHFDHVRGKCDWPWVVKCTRPIPCL